MGSLLTYEEALELTGPFHANYVEAHDYAMESIRDGLTRSPRMFKDFKDGTLKGMVHDLITAEINRTVGGFDWSTGGPWIFVHPIQGRALIRFKWLSPDDLSPRSYPTEQQELLARQEYTEPLWTQLQFHGFPAPPTLLTCGYTDDLQDFDNPLRVIIVCRSPELRFWYEIREAGEGEIGGAVVSFPNMPPTAPRVVSDIAEEQEPTGGLEG
jgi:hypothetical protein